MYKDNYKTSSLEKTIFLVILLGLANIASWIISTILLPEISIGWIIHIVVTAVAWLQLVITNRTHKMPNTVWVLIVLSIVSGVVAYTLCSTDSLTPIFSLTSGLAGGLLLFLIGVVLDQTKN